MTAKKIPDYLKVNTDGSVDITLAKPLTINGTKVPTLRMREPTINDQLVMEATDGSPALKEIGLFANLCEQSPDDIKRLTTRSYQRVQDGFTLFTD